LTRKPKQRFADPGQLALFGAADERPLARVPAAMVTPARAKPRRTRPQIVERPAVLTPKEAALYLNVSVSTLKNWRALGIGPRWRRRGARLVSYFPADLDAFLREQGGQIRNR
jgi:hypothetical protein